MVFITHCLKNARLDLFGLLICVGLTWGLPGFARADAPVAEISLLKLERDADSVLLTATVKFELPAAVQDALLKGIPLFFLAEADILRERWYWSLQCATAHAPGLSALNPPLALEHCLRSDYQRRLGDGPESKL
jgi:hypothetical protein